MRTPHQNPWTMVVALVLVGCVGWNYAVQRTASGNTLEDLERRLAQLRSEVELLDSRLYSLEQTAPRRSMFDEAPARKADLELAEQRIDTLERKVGRHGSDLSSIQMELREMDTLKRRIDELEWNQRLQ